jgi:hypothetical protein
MASKRTPKKTTKKKRTSKAPAKKAAKKRTSKAPAKKAAKKRATKRPAKSSRPTKPAKPRAKRAAAAAAAAVPVPAAASVSATERVASYLEEGVPHDHAELVSGLFQVVRGAAKDLKTLITQAIAMSNQKNDPFGG